MKPNPSGTLILGVGNPHRSDDGVGVALARRLQSQVPPHITVREASGEGAALMEAWKGFSRVWVIDAVHSGAMPGAIHRLDAHAAPIPSQFFHCSTHAFSVAEAVEMARALDELPPFLVLYGIEGAVFEAGEGFSAEVKKAADAVISRVITEVIEKGNEA